MFTAPIVITVLAPEYGRRIFENLEYASLSGWSQVFVAMNGAVWGLSQLEKCCAYICRPNRKVKR